MNCNECFTEFDNSTHAPKILPCSGLTCLKCLENMPHGINRYLIKCKTCSKDHIFSNLTDLQTSDIALHLSNKNESSSLVNFSENLKDSLRNDNYEIHKHFDNVINDIDIKAETLIQFIHSSREQLQEQIKVHQKKCIAIFR